MALARRGDDLAAVLAPRGASSAAKSSPPARDAQMLVLAGFLRHGLEGLGLNDVPANRAAVRDWSIAAQAAGAGAGRVVSAVASAGGVIATQDGAEQDKSSQ
jgi:hypothetical protein